MIVIHIFVFLAIKHFLAHHVFRGMLNQNRKNVLNNCPEETKTVEKKPHKREFYQPWLENERFKP